MAKATNRVSAFPGRVKLVPVGGQTNVYDMTKSDSPSVVGTLLNKDFLDQKADLDADGKILASQSSSKIVSVGTNLTLGLTHAGKWLYCIGVGGGNQVITVPDYNMVAFPDGTEIEMYKDSNNDVTFQKMPGVTFLPSMTSFKIDGRYKSASLKCLGGNYWAVQGYFI